MNFKLNKEYLQKNIKDLMAIDSPSGYCHTIMKTIETWSNDFGYEFELTNKGCGIISVPGLDSSKTIAVAAHVDTLGAMVRSISSDGTIKFTLIGGPIPPTLDSEYCTIHTRKDETYTGTFLSIHPAAHVHKEAGSAPRNPDTMEVRLDEVVKTKEDVLALGISVGDFICIDPKTTITESGFVKSRFLDDKVSVACLFTTMEYLSSNKIKPKYNTKFFISAFEEVGHGAAYMPPEVSEVLAVDMGCIGLDLTCTEYDVSICAKDSSGPYDYHMVSNLIELSNENELSYAVDIYPFYGSDVSSALRSGNNIKGALIGPGVYASHGLERTHMDGLENTIRLLYLYLTK